MLFRPANVANKYFIFPTLSIDLLENLGIRISYILHPHYTQICYFRNFLTRWTDASAYRIGLHQAAKSRKMEFSWS